jgi:hypothetical protein
LCSRWRSCLAARASATFFSWICWRSVFWAAEEKCRADDDGILLFRTRLRPNGAAAAAADNLLIVCGMKSVQSVSSVVGSQ